MDIRENGGAFAVMAVIIIVNIGLATNLAISGGTALTAVLNSQSIYLLVALELSLVLVAYVTAKQRRLPIHSE